MNMIVTGGAGFIGLNFVKLAKEKKHNILVVDSFTYAANKEAKQIFKDLNVELIEKDINDLDWADVKHFDPEIIINFAAESHVDNSIKNPKLFVETNVNGTLNLLLIAKENNLRYHQISTDEVYGDLPLDKPEEKFTEETPIKPSSPYSSSKASADLLVHAFERTYGLKTTITRCSNNYGPYQNKEKLIPMTIGKMLNGEPMGVYGDGKNVRDWIYVDDHNEAVLFIINNFTSGVYNVGSSNEINNISIVNTVGDILDIPEDKRIKFIDDRQGHDRRYAIDMKFLNSLGWKAEIDFKEGIEKTIDFYKK